MRLAFIKSVSLFVAASRIRYEITSGNIGGAFAVKNMTGAIYVAGALDYETRKRVGIVTNVTQARCWNVRYIFRNRSYLSRNIHIFDLPQK